MANRIGGIAAHVTGLFDELMRNDFLECSRPRSVTFGRTHLVSSLLSILYGGIVLLSRIRIGIGYLGYRGRNFGILLTLFTGLWDDEGTQVRSIWHLLPMGLTTLTIADALLGLVERVDCACGWVLLF